ncbi:MAG: hypothetical protein IPK71_26250 [Myxococcales bacterium]|nr:hypothetical protein [Myxococcales bacterium]
MYRSLGKLGSFGVPSGPYTGAPRRFIWRKLPVEVQKRLARSLDGRGRPAPIAIDVRRPSRLYRALVLGSVAGTLGLAALVVGSWSHVQPRETMFLYALVALPLALLAAAVGHRWLVRGGAPLDPGKVLLPLDLLVFDGRVLTLTPLGSVRDVGVVGDGPSLRLVLSFEAGDEVAFPMPSTTHAERTYDALVEAQRTLEELSYGDDLARALDRDPFFSARSTEALSRAEVAAEPAKVPGVGWAFALAALLALLFGRGAHSATNELSDRIRFKHALVADTDEAMRAYLAAGGLRRREAELYLGGRAMERRKSAVLDATKERIARNEALLVATVGAPIHDPPGFVKPRDAAEWNAAHAECLRAITARAPTSRKALPLLTALVDEARRGVGGPAHLGVHFERATTGMAVSPALRGSLEARERETARALAVIFSEVCPRSVLDVRHVAEKLADGSPGIRVRYALDKPATRTASGQVVTLAEIRFDVTLEVWPKKPTGFSLTMPAPVEARTATRTPSVFRIDDRAPLDVRLLDAFTARAFDRLYDELYGLFFEGNVKVPLPGFAEVERIFMR